ncbi:MAG: response regulator [Desulfobacteraceae bacterium]|nr:response regulator [Desulfobacteraceae bacterium]
MAKILVLDDVEDAANLIKRILKSKGHTVLTFTDEEEALDSLDLEKIDLAILDMKLKKMTGIEVLEELKKRSPETRVIMLTGYPTIETARQSVKLGAQEYCVKPIDKQELEEKVEQVLAM